MRDLKTSTIEAQATWWSRAPVLVAFFAVAFLAVWPHGRYDWTIGVGE